MRREDLKNWTRDMLKDRIIELGGIIEQWKRDNGEMLQIVKKTKMKITNYGRDSKNWKVVYAVEVHALYLNFIYLRASHGLGRLHTMMFFSD